MKKFDVLIIGGGPAGLNAAMYAVRKELSVAIVTTDIGGQMLLTNDIENYLGFSSISGFELSEKMESHVKNYSIEFITAQVLKLEKGDNFKAHLDDQTIVESKTCIITSGKRSRTLDIPGEAEFTGKGVSYCATCDGPFYRNKTVAIVGGGDSAIQAAIELAVLSPKVYLLVRSRIRAQEILVKRMHEYKNIEVMIGYTPEEIKGDKKVHSVIIKNKENEQLKELEIDGIFVEAGGIPNVGFLPKEVEKNKAGEIITSKNACTTVQGLFAAGDVTDNKYKQVIIAAGEGASAALSAHEYLLMSGK